MNDTVKLEGYLPEKKTKGAQLAETNREMDDSSPERELTITGATDLIRTLG